jgi:uncharacterized protein YciI/uncharacterized damage-inducible protein DinB
VFDREDALQLLDYEAWADARLEDALGQWDAPSTEALRQWAHVVAVLELFLARVLAEDYRKVVVWGEAGLAELVERRKTVSARWRRHVEGLDAAALAREVQFTNSLGAACRDPLEAILKHMSFHGAHHRARIAAELRAAGRTPPALDYILWRRELQERPKQATHFVVELTYTAPIEKVDALLQPHRAHLARGYSEGLLLASGPKEPRVGGIILARAASKAELEAFLAEDPFATAGIATYRVIEFHPVKQQPWLRSWVEGR